LVSQLVAADDGQPVLRWGTVQVARSVGRLWLFPKGQPPAGAAQPLEPANIICLQAGNGRLHLTRQAGGLALCSGRWEVGYRAGGELIRLAGRPARSLKQLFQENAVPVWLRPAVPLLYRDGALVSVAGRWNDPEGCGIETMMYMYGTQGRERMLVAQLDQRFEQHHGIQPTGQPQPPDRGVPAGRQSIEQPLRCEHAYLIPKAIKRS
jgi:tRNA(Ile)-lysidine synthetase-like protein